MNQGSRTGNWLSIPVIDCKAMFNKMPGTYNEERKVFQEAVFRKLDMDTHNKEMRHLSHA